MAAVAARQHGVVSRAQLLAIGLGSRAVESRLAAGRLHATYRGVYAVGHARVTMRARWMAAVLASGLAAVLSHRAAAALQNIRRSEAIEVTTPQHRRARTGILLHQARLAPDEITTVDGIPVTTVFRTLIDLAAVLPRHQLERAVNETERLQIAEPIPLGALIARHRHRRGVKTLKAINDDLNLGATITRSELEDRFIEFLDENGLPRPRTNKQVDGHECDCVWPTHRLIVELDGHANHSSRAAYERDRARDRRLMTAGWRVIRITWRQLHRDRLLLQRDLGRLLD